MGDKFKASEGTYRVKIQVGSEESYGGGGSITEAKQAAALQVAFRLKYFFKINSYSFCLVNSPGFRKNYIYCPIQLQALMTTKHVFEDLPPMLNPAPSTEMNPGESEDTQHWNKYQYEDLESSSDYM